MKGFYITLALVLSQLVLTAFPVPTTEEDEKNYLYHKIMTDLYTAHNESFIHQKFILGQHFTLFRQEDGTYKADVSTAQEMVSWIRRSMMAFIDETVFDVQDFFDQVGLFEIVFFEIESIFDPRAKAAIHDQLFYLKEVFEVMARLVPLLRMGHLSGSPGHRLLHLMVDLNVRILILFDEVGDPNISGVPQFAEMVRMFRRSVNYWDFSFSQLYNVPSNIRLMFNDQKAKAEQSLKVLGVRLE